METETRKLTDRERLALEIVRDILNGNLEGYIEQFDRLRNNEQIPLAEENPDRLQIDAGSVVDVSVMPNDEIYIVTKEKTTTLWRLDFPLRNVASAPRIELLGCREDVPIYLMIEERYRQVIVFGYKGKKLIADGLTAAIGRPTK